MSNDEIERLINEGRIDEALKVATPAKQEASTSQEPTFTPKEPAQVDPERGVLPPKTSTLEPQQADGFDIKDPFELLCMLDDAVASGRVVLHQWQVQFMLDFAAGGASDNEPFQALVRACNGSGKNK